MDHQKEIDEFVRAFKAQKIENAKRRAAKQERKSRRARRQRNKMIDYAREFPWLDIEHWKEWRAYRNSNKRWGPLTVRAERVALQHLETVFPTKDLRHSRIDYAMVQGWRGLVWPNELQDARRKVEQAAKRSAKPHPLTCVACGKGADGHSAGVGPTCGDCRGRIARERQPAPRGFRV